MSRIKIEDLPLLQTLSAEEQAAILGAGRPRARLDLESLEGRDLMTSGLTASMAVGTLTIKDTTAGDTIRVRQINNQISVDGVNIATATGSLARVAANQVTQIRVMPLGGRDLIDLDSQSVPGQQGISDEVFIHSGPGSDTIRYGGGKTFLDGHNQSILEQPNGTLAITPLAAPKLTGPSGTIAASSGYDTPTFTWNSVAGANHYLVYAVDDSTGAVPINFARTTGTSYTASAPLTPGHRYTWYVEAASVNNAFLTRSTGKTFTLASLAAPALTGLSGSIAASTGYDTPTFTWNNVVGANHYYIYVVDDRTGAPVINNASVGGTSYTPTSALTPGHEYTWYVGAESTNSRDIAWSAERTFTLAALAAPTLIGFSGSIAASTAVDTPIFAWNGVAGAANYQIYLVDNTAGNQILLSTLVGNNTSYTPGAALMPVHSYTWYIGAVSTNSTAIAWSSARRFTVAAATSGLGLTDGTNLGAKVVAYAQQHIGQEVGDGQCTDLAINALEYAGAKTTYDYGVSGLDVDYVWGVDVSFDEINPPIYASGGTLPNTPVLPGDVIQYSNVTLNYPNGSYSHTGTEHTAIIEAVLGGGQYKILEQNWDNNNPDGMVVRETTINLSYMTQGTYWIYQPVAK